MQVLSKGIKASVSYNGNFNLHDNYGTSVAVVLRYGTSQDESTWTTTSNTVYYYKSSNATQELTFWGLTPGKKYYGKITIYKEYYDYHTGSQYRVFEQEFALDSFELESEIFYEVEKIFPDPVLREKIWKKCSYKPMEENATISSADLKAITFLDISDRTDPFIKDIKDITGIELLTELTDLRLNNNEIDDITGIDWAKLTKLKSLDLKGNNITKIPDLTKNTKLKYVYLEENMLSEEEIANASDKVPQYVNIGYNNQRTKGFALELDDSFYVYPSGSTIYAKATGYKTRFPYTIKFYIDGKPQTFEVYQSYNQKYCLKDSNLSLGEHTIKAELIWNDTVQEVSPEVTFILKEGRSYQLKEVFPDPVLRAQVLKSINDSSLTEESEIFVERLEKIKYLYIPNRTSLDTEAVKDLTGLDLLAGLTSLTIDNHEIENVTDIDWSKLSELDSLSLEGNNISVMPDLTKNTKLKYVYLNDNMLSEKEIANAYSKIPENVYLGYDNQRAEGFSLQLEDDYYIYADGSAVYVKVTGYRSAFPYTFKFYLDGEEQNLTLFNAYNHIYAQEKGTLSLGKHTIKAEMLWNGTVKETSKEYTFEIKKEDTFIDGGKCYFSSYDANRNYLYIPLYSINGKTIKNLSVVNDKDKVYAKSKEERTMYSQSTEPRFSTLSMPIYKLFYGNISLEMLYNAIPAGSYDIKIEYADNTTERLEDVVIVAPTDEVIITDCSIGYDYDSTGDYIYLMLEGNNINPTMLDYSISKQGVDYPVSYVNYKEVYSGVIVKLKKNGWTRFNGYDSYKMYSADVKISGKKGYTVVTGDVFGSVSIDSGIYYCVYNEITKQLEVAFSTALNGNNQPVDISVRLGWDAKQYPEIATGTATVTDGVAYFDLKNPDGTAFEPKRPVNYYYTCTLQGKEYIDSIYINNQDSSSYNYVSGSSIILEGTKDSNFYFSSDIPYNEENADTSKYHAEITGDLLPSPVEVGNLWTYASAYNYLTIGMSFDTEKLVQGRYKMTLYKEDVALTEYYFEIKGRDKFILENVSASWQSKEEIRLYVSTPNTDDTNEYDVILTDMDGNTVSGITAKVTNRYSASLYISVKGLHYLDAKKQYYIKIINKTLGDAYTATGDLYYSDARGKQQTIYTHGVSMAKKDGRMIGLHLMHAEFPVEVKIYKPYQTDAIVELTLNDKSVLKDGTYYYFNKSLYDALPLKNSVYEVIIIENNNKVTSLKMPLGYTDLGEDEKVWNYTMNRTSLFLNSEDENTATITVTDYTKAPTFMSSDTSVVKVTVDKNDPSKAVVTAVGLGIAQISITADGITKTFDITVDRKVVIEELSFNRTELTLSVGNSCELTASVRPIEAWTENSTISFTSSDETVVAVAEGTSEEEVTITALKAGTAVITAALDGTEYKAECKVTVTGSYTADQQESLVQKAGTKYVLLNAYDKNTATLAEVDLSAGWSWVDDTVKLIADNDAPIQKYMARYESEGQEAFTALLPVAVSKLTGIAVEGATKILTGTDSNAEIVLKYIGYQPIGNEYDEYLTYSWTAAGRSPIVEIISPSAKKTILSTKECLEKNMTQSVNVAVTMNQDAKKTFKTTLKITVIPEPYVDMIAIDYAMEQLPTEIVDSVYENNILQINSSSINKNSNTVCFDAWGLCDGADPNTPVKLKWTTSDSSVVTVKAQKNGNFAVVTAKKAGSAVIKVTALDGGKLEQELEVKISDFTPIIENTNLTVNLYSSVGTVIPVKAQNGNTITDIKILENDAVSEKLTVTKVEDNFILKTKDGYTAAKNQKIKAVLEITTANKDIKLQALNITIDVKKPTASVKLKAKANLFYSLCLGAYTVSSKNEIASIEDVTGNVTTRFEAYYNKEQGLIYVTPNLSLTSKTLAEFKKKNSTACKVKLKVNFVGYSEEASQIINVTVATEEKKPTLKLGDLILMPGVTSGAVDVINTKTKQVVDFADIKVISDNSKTHDVTTAKSADKVTVTYAGDKNATYKAQITSELWTSALTVNGKITVAKSQNLMLDNSKVILNTAHNIQENGKLAIGVSVKNHGGAVQGIRYEIDKKNAPLFNNGYLSITYNAQEQQVYVGLNKGNRGKIKAGSYKVNLYGTVLAGEKEVEIKPATLTVTLVDKAPTISMKAKGSIDLVRRDTTSIVYTPNLGNVTAKVEDVKLTGSYADYFKASVDENGNVVLTAKDQPMSTKITYSVKMVLTLDNDTEVTTTVKVKPANKTPKLAAGLTKATLYKTSPETVSFTVTSKSDDTKIASITRVEDKNSKYFTFKYEEGKVSVSLTDTARKLKPGKYTISYQVTMEGAAYNVKPTTMKFTVIVK